jgi:hypothetical protein
MTPNDAKTKPLEFYGGYQVYSDTGIDLTLLRQNLMRTVEQRLENNRRALEMAYAFQHAGRAARRSISSAEERVVMVDAPAIIRLLVSSQVEFVVIGGLAMRAQGSAHVTEDADFCYRRTPDNIARLAAALVPINPYLRGAPAGLPFRFDAPTIQAGLNFTLTTDLGDIDFLGEVSGIGNYDAVLVQSDELEVSGLKVRVLSLDGLIAAKKAAGRVKDRNQLVELLELKKLRDAAQ